MPARFALLNLLAMAAVQMDNAAGIHGGRWARDWTGGQPPREEVSNVRRKILPAIVSVLSACALSLAMGLAGQPVLASAPASAPALASTVGNAGSSTIADIIAVKSGGSGTRAANSLRVVSPAQTSDTITCALQVNYPHLSTHVPGTVNVTASTTCTAPVTYINMKVGLYYNGTLVTQNSFSGYNTTEVDGNAAAPCQNGTYTGAATAAVTFPPGYEPSPQNLGPVYSPNISITCPT